MPYAKNGQISTEPIEGGIEITAEQYDEALAGMLAGRVVSVDEGFAVIDPPEPEPQEPTPPAPRTQFSVREFRQRFTLAEQVAIRAASMTNMEAGLVYDEFLSAQFIDVADEATAQGIDTYIRLGLLDASRRDELLAPAETQGEV